MVKYCMLLALCVSSAYAQNGAVPLTNDTVIRLVASGVPSETVIKTIQAASSVSFGFLPSDLALFQRYNVPDDVVKAMAAKAHARPQQAVATPAKISPAQQPTASADPQRQATLT